MKLGGTNDFCSGPGVEDLHKKSARGLYRSFLLNIGGRVFGTSHLKRHFGAVSRWYYNRHYGIGYMNAS